MHPVCVSGDVRNSIKNTNKRGKKIIKTRRKKKKKPKQTIGIKLLVMHETKAYLFNK